MNSVIVWLLAGTVAAVTVAGGEQSFDRSYGVEVGVDATGRVVDVVTQDDAPEGLAPMLEDLAGKLRFTPATANGAPVPSRTSVNVQVRHTPRGSARFDAIPVAVREGGGWQLRRDPPAYPHTALRRGYGARVVLLATFDEDGRLLKDATAVERVDVTRRERLLDEERAAAFHDVFADVVLAHSEDWKITPNEVDGRRYGMTVRVPVVFCTRRFPRGCEDLYPALDLPDRFAPTDESIALAELRPVRLQATGAGD